MLRTNIWHAFTLDTVIVGPNGSHHLWSAFLSSINTNDKLNSVFLIIIISNIHHIWPAISLIQIKKIQNIISISPCHRH